MEYIFLNLKRFDIRPELGGVNRLAVPSDWGSTLAASIHTGLLDRARLLHRCAFAVFFPEAHILNAASSIPVDSPLGVGCQSVHHDDTAKGGNFGAFTSLRTANSARELGCSWTIIGHSEERRYKADLMAMAGAVPEKAVAAVDVLLNRQIACAIRAGLKVVYCIGETTEEASVRDKVLRRQIDRGLAGVDLSGVVIAYEPIWAIGPGKTPPTAEQIASIVAGIKRTTPCPLVYGGGLKKENAASIGGISELDGGLIALTRFEGAIGFYPDEYLEIVDAYFRGRGGEGGTA